jgi:hypothetical protein
MILALLVWTYITFICFTWGHMVLRLIPGSQSFYKQPEIQWPIVCFTGLAILGILTYWFSIFIPIGLKAHIIIVTPVILYHLSVKKVRDLYKNFSILKANYSHLYYLVLITAVAMVLFISTYTIIHPDTTMYHAPAIKWMETYKAVPGIVNIDSRLGYQSWWFAVQALFRFSFVKPNNFLFINGCVLCWFLVFVASHIDYWFKKLKEKHPSAVYFLPAWIVLLIISLLCWTQVRLTAASASPDFITALYIWCAVYLFFKRGTNNVYFTLLITILSCAAITMKLSAAVIILLPVCLGYGLARQKKYKVLILLSIVSTLLIAPCIVRNVINSGYPLYPSPALNIIEADWKTTTVKVQKESNYIKAYARFPFDDFDQAEKIIQLPVSQWLPVWWDHVALADKSLLILILFLLVWNIFTFPIQFRNRDYTNLVILSISLTGSFFWFITAPSLRFGIGFLIPLLFSLYTGFTPFTGLAKLIKPSWYKAAVLCTCLFVIVYTVHRCIYFFQPRQLLVPLGLSQPDYIKDTSQGTPIYVNTSSTGCGFLPVPCFISHPPDFIMRGKEISEGFKRAEKESIHP